MYIILLSGDKEVVIISLISRNCKVLVNKAKFLLKPYIFKLALSNTSAKFKSAQHFENLEISLKHIQI